jgi:hypothetical protein
MGRALSLQMIQNEVLAGAEDVPEELLKETIPCQE